MLGKQIRNRFSHSQLWIRQRSITGATNIINAGRGAYREHCPISVAFHVGILFGIQIDRKPVGVHRKCVSTFYITMIKSRGVVVGDRLVIIAIVIIY